MDILSFILGYKKGIASGGGGSTGGGGSSLSPGVYWRQRMLLPKKDQNLHFIYNGGLYLATRLSDNTFSFAIYKYENGTYTQVASNKIGFSWFATTIVEYNGKVHFLGGDDTFHYVWDGGTTFTAKASIPKSCYGQVGFVYGGKLYMLSTQYGLYKWDETANTWGGVSMANDPTKYCYGKIVMYGDDPYFIYNKSIYKLDMETKTYVLVSELGLPENINNAEVAVIGDYLYMTYGSSNSALGTNKQMAKYNFATNTLHLLDGFALYNGSYQLALAYDGKFILSGGSNQYQYCYEMFEVEATE